MQTTTMESKRVAFVAALVVTAWMVMELLLPPNLPIRDLIRAGVALVLLYLLSANVGDVMRVVGMALVAKFCFLVVDMVEKSIA